MIITLILLGRYIETGAKGRSSDVITRLLSLNPKEAKKLIEEISGARSYETVAVSSIKSGDIVQIGPGERIPLDGIVREGNSEIDESMLTGEAKPVAKESGDEVFCGTQNLYGSLIFEVSRTGDDTILSGIIKTVENAQARRAPVQALVDRIVGYFVPAVILLSLGTCLFWLFHVGSFERAIMNAVSVLVIACPCALGLATPLAVLIGTTKGASKGILFKGGDIIERAKNIDTIVLDKTGTLTEGKPHLAYFAGIGISDDEALRLCLSLEKASEHSIANAIVNAGSSMPTHDITDFRAHPGEGISGMINGKAAFVGSRNFVESTLPLESIEREIVEEQRSRVKLSESSGGTVIYLGYDKRLTGLFCISDKIRNSAEDSVNAMQAAGYDVMMITGDVYETAAAVAREVGIPKDAVMARKMPVEKADAISNRQEEGRRVMMVGDGINDAPSLVQADVGMAMGRATDIALESADMVLMRNDLELITGAVKLAKRTYRVIRQNLFWAFAYNMVALPLAVAGLLHPIVAAISMTLSSLSVVGNSMRLRRG